MIYKNIEAKCKEKGISISALEKAVGLGNATIKGWVDSSPKVDNLMKVADFFGCTVDELLSDDFDIKSFSIGNQPSQRI